VVDALHIVQQAFFVHLPIPQAPGGGLSRASDDLQAANELP
jgi:hypothetical protein